LDAFFRGDKYFKAEYNEDINSIILKFPEEEIFIELL